MITLTCRNKKLRTDLQDRCAQDLYTANGSHPISLIDVMICPCVACYSHVPLRGRHRCQENWHWQLRRLCSASKVPRRVCSQTPRIRETVCPRPRGASCPAVWTWVMLGLVLAKHWGRTTSRNGQPPETCENTNTNWSASNLHNE